MTTWKSNGERQEQPVPTKTQRVSLSKTFEMFHFFSSETVRCRLPLSWLWLQTIPKAEAFRLPEQKCDATSKLFKNCKTLQWKWYFLSFTSTSSCTGEFTRESKAAKALRKKKYFFNKPDKPSLESLFRCEFCETQAGFSFECSFQLEQWPWSSKKFKIRSKKT